MTGVRSWAPAFAGAPSRERGSRDGGFTLIEMMVALAVFSLAALALIRLEGATIRSTGILDETLVAQMVARNVAVEALTDAQPPTIGTATGAEANGGRSWTWTRRTSALGDAGALRIDIAVAPGAGRPIARLMVVRRPGAVS
ncbi:MAG TPA: type II secretion system minor pseudopilin GspI [Sphingomonas sp.]|nr:type II secretion system minor pseudopilin GspI [Sphingomonas sp.]